MQNENRDTLTYAIIGAAMEVHSALGPGLLESTYEACLAYELSVQGYSVQSQVCLPVKYKDVELDTGYRIDLLVERRVVVELKAAETLLPIHEAQLISYLKLSGIHRGLLINFNVKRLKDGIIRRVV